MGQEVMRWHIRACKHQLLALAVDQRHRGANVLARSRSLCHVHNRDTGQTRELVCLALDRHALIHTAELHGTGDLCNDRVSVRVPGRDNIARRDRRLILNANGRAVRYLVALTLPTHAVEQRELPRARDGDQRAIWPIHDFHVVETNHTVVVHLNIVLSRLP